jgi:hypothetical protein
LCSGKLEKAKDDVSQLTTELASKETGDHVSHVLACTPE